MKLIKQTVYLPVKIGSDTGLIVKSIHSGHKYPIEKEEGYFFTSEQLNEYTQNVIKQALDIAAENAEYNTDGQEHIEKVWIDKQSITNTFEETFKRFEL